MVAEPGCVPGQMQVEQQNLMGEIQTINSHLATMGGQLQELNNRLLIQEGKMGETMSLIQASGNDMEKTKGDILRNFTCGALLYSVV